MTTSLTEIARAGGPSAEPQSVTAAGGRDRKQLVFVWCCAGIAVHLLVDAFIDLRPGTSPSDHLVSGTVPLAALVALAWVFGHVRAGLGATIALLLGAATVMAGAAPVAAIVGRGRFTLGPLTGVVGAVAGIVLVVLGTMMLFRTRRTSGGRARPVVRRLARGLLGVVLGLVLSVSIGSAYITANWPLGYDLDEVPVGPEHERITLETTDGLTLAAAYLPSKNGASIILFPSRAPEHTELLAKHGYGVLVLEPRGRHDSDGDVHLLGWTGEEDLRAAVRYLQSRPDVVDDRIGGLGLSVGGELLLQTAANEPALLAVVSEGAGARSVAEDLRQPVPVTEWPAAAVFFAGSAVTTAATAVFSDSLPPAPLHDLVDDIAPRPIMLIWTPNGEADERPNPEYYERAGEPKTIWEIPEGGHVGGIHARPDEYEQRVIQFFDQALLGGGDRS